MPDFCNKTTGFGHWIPAFAGMTVLNCPNALALGQTQGRLTLPTHLGGGLWVGVGVESRPARFGAERGNALTLTLSRREREQPGKLTGQRSRGAGSYYPPGAPGHTTLPARRGETGRRRHCRRRPGGAGLGTGRPPIQRSSVPPARSRSRCNSGLGTRPLPLVEWA